MKIRKHIYFNGMVQGVGFRYRAMYAARELGLTGWVRNLSDGRVEMEIQGSRENIERMFFKLSEGKFIHITDIEEKEKPAEEEERDFHIIGY